VGPDLSNSLANFCMCLQGSDDITGEPLIQQEDDRPAALVARLRHYKDVAKPVIDFYKYAHKTFIGITSLLECNPKHNQCACDCTSMTLSQMNE